MSKGKDVPFSKYIHCGAGVCRENAILTHVLLKEAGIENTHMYATIHRMNHPIGNNIQEDHAFNGYKLKDLMSKEGITPESEMSPIAQKYSEFRRIIKFNNYPKVWIAKKHSGCMGKINAFLNNFY